VSSLPGLSYRLTSVCPGADVDVRSTWGWYTPLHLAAKGGHEAVCAYLMENGARWGKKDKVSDLSF
jgi:ankyrin repeat protein